MKTERPFYLNLMQIKLPIGGWVSIFHRVTGAGLSLAIPVVLFVLMLSLRSAEDFADVADFLSGGFGLLIVLALVWAVLHHLLAGLRHLGFDIAWGEAKERARLSAWGVLFAALGLTGIFALGVFS
jgi:succinate dehydrogenase / fumarate reductase cytochrome b subunit